MTIRPTIADADGDIAALIYAQGDRPDVVLCAFARHLSNAGRRLTGLIQFRQHAPDASPSRVMVLDTWQEVDVGHRDAAAGDGHCRLDARWLNAMGTRAEATIRRGVDAAIVNRFGPLEAAGRGFRDAILAASDTRTPLVVAVPDFEFERWVRFSAGMAVRLDCRLDSVLDWWRRAANVAAPDIVSGRRSCEAFK